MPTKDITEWNELREIPSMPLYYRNMNLTGVTFREQVRLRRYPWKDADGAWVWSAPRREASVTAGKGEWRQLSLAFTVPEGVHKAVVLVCAKDQAADDIVWFDDVRLVKAPAGDGEE